MRSQVLGLFGDIVNGIGNIFSGIANWFSDRIGQYIDYFVSIILKFVYEILKIFFILIDFVQILFRKIAGLDTVRYNGQDNISGDIAWWLFQQPAVTDALISLIVVAVVMLFMAVFVAIIRNNYKAKEAKETAIGPVIGQAFKALFSFIFVPIVCYFGVFVSNGLLKTIDQATRISDAVSISGEVFSASAMSANRARLSSDFAATLNATPGLNFGIFQDDNTGVLTGKTAAEKVDRAFASQQKVDARELTIDDSMAGCEFMFHQQSPGTISQFDYRNTNLVFVYYDLTKFNWLFAFVSCFFITTTLLYAAMGVVQRLFEITLLFAISPPFIALMPLDGGSAFKNWAQKFIQSTVIMYGTVVALNFFFIIAPMLQQIDLFYSADEIATYGKLTCDLFNGFAHILFIMCGSLMIKDFTSLLTELTAGKAASLNERGEKAYGEAKNNAASMASKASAVHGAASKAYDSRFSPKAVQARKEAKEAKAAYKDQKAANKAVAKGMRDAGQVGYWGSRRLLAEQNAKDAGKQTLRTRARNWAIGENKNISAKSAAFEAERNNSLTAKENPFATAQTNKFAKGVFGRIKSGAGAIVSGKPITERGSAKAKVARNVAKNQETAAMKAYRTARKEKWEASTADLETVKKWEKNKIKDYKKQGYSRKEAKEKASNDVYYTSEGLKQGSYNGNLKNAQKDLKKAKSLKKIKTHKTR